MRASTLLCVATVSLISGTVRAAPMDLRDQRPRWVEVAFEVSPASEPYRLQAVYTERVPAWFEPVPDLGQVRVTVDSDLVERYLFSGERPKGGSFSDFVWIFDVASGEVVSATLTGTLLRRLDWGIARPEVETEIAAEMSSEGAAGFEPARRLLGHVLYRFCSDEDSSRCTVIPGRRYDFASGYVNAVGGLAVGSHILSLRVFSPLGEAVFSEIETGEDPRAATAALDFEVPAPSPDAVAGAIGLAGAQPHAN